MSPVGIVSSVVIAFVSLVIGVGLGAGLSDLLASYFIWKRKTALDQRYEEGRRLGYAEGAEAGAHIALVEITRDEERPTNYRLSAAKIARICPMCTRMCIHCAREKSKIEAA